MIGGRLTSTLDSQVTWEATPMSPRRRGSSGTLCVGSNISNCGLRDWVQFQTEPLTVAHTGQRLVHWFILGYPRGSNREQTAFEKSARIALRFFSIRGFRPAI